MPAIKSIETIKISGFKSLEDINLSFDKTNILIGSNGSGKSNVLCFFEMLKFVHGFRLEEFVLQHGGADDLLFGGIRTTSEINADINFRTKSRPIGYEFTLKHFTDDNLIYKNENYVFDAKEKITGVNIRIDKSNTKDGISRLNSPKDIHLALKTGRTIYQFLENLNVYQFHDTSKKSNFNVRCDYQDSNFLHSDGGNLAAILYRLAQEDYQRFELISRQIERVLPVFDRFMIEESYGKVSLRWKAKGRDKTFGPHLTSDGSLRFFALVTLLNLPKEMLPNVILLDEPELGLHPKAVILIGNMINSVSNHVQTIVATQSPLLVDQFEVEEITVLDLEKGCTKCRKLKLEDYRDWLEKDFSIGDLWLKNLLGGQP